MSEQAHVGLSLVNKAPLGFIVSIIVAVIAVFSFSELEMCIFFYFRGINTPRFRGCVVINDHGSFTLFTELFFCRFLVGITRL